jgi:hypothetical protein
VTDRRPPLIDEDDWFATPAVEPVELPGEVAWQDEPEPPPGPPEGLARRQAMVLVAVVAAIALGAAGILLARSLGGSDDTSTTIQTTGLTTQVTTGATTGAKTTPTDSTPTTSTPTSTTPSTTPVPTDTTLRAGSSGASVIALQQALTTLGFPPGAADGKYGTATTEAVTAFQKANSLTEDGVAGPKTIAAINAAAASG